MQRVPEYRTNTVFGYYSGLNNPSLGRLYKKCFAQSNRNVHKTVRCFISTIMYTATNEFLNPLNVVIPQNTAVDPIDHLGGASRRKRRTRAKKATKKRKITKRKCNIKHNKRRYTKHKRAKKASKHTRKRKH